MRHRLHWSSILITVRICWKAENKIIEDRGTQKRTKWRWLLHNVWRQKLVRWFSNRSKHPQAWTGPVGKRRLTWHATNHASLSCKTRVHIKIKKSFGTPRERELTGWAFEVTTHSSNFKPKRKRFFENGTNSGERSFSKSSERSNCC